jgi:hypothetical protein
MSKQLHIALVNLGDNIDPWLLKYSDYLLKLCSELNFEFTIICDNQTHVERVSKLGFNTFLYVRDSSISQLLTESQIIREKFRSNFWFLTLERLLCLQQFHETHPETPLLHLENDSFVFPYFPFDSFIKLKKLAWLMSSENNDCAAIFASPNLEETQWFCSKAIELFQINPMHTDMTLLHEIRRLEPEKIQVLPSITQSMCNTGFKSSVMVLDENSIFKGIFDPGLIGIWISGEDPRNTGGKILRGRNSYNFFGTLQWNMLSLKNSILYIDNIPIYSLHVHSKDKKLLSKDWKMRLTFLLNLKSDGFSLWGYRKAQIDLFTSVNRSFVRYIYVKSRLYKIIQFLKL